MNDYYSIDDIITDGQRLPCNFEISVPGLGYLQGEMGTDINKGTKIELPLWLAELLAMSGISSDSNQSFVSLLEPPMLSQKVINALKSEPTSVDLMAQSPVFYRLVNRWLSIFGDEELAKVVTQTLTKRANILNDFAANPRGQMADQTDFLSKLDHDEQLLYKTVYESTKTMRKFLSGDSNSQ